MSSKVRKNNFERLKRSFEVNYKKIPKIEHMLDFNYDVLTMITINLPDKEKQYQIMYLRSLCFIHGFKQYFWTEKSTGNDVENYYWNLETNSYEYERS